MYGKHGVERPCSCSAQSCMLIDVLRNRRIFDNAALVLISQGLMRAMQYWPLEDRRWTMRRPR